MNNYLISVINKSNSEYVEEILTNILSDDTSTILRYNKPGEWYYIDQTTLPVLRTIIYNIVLLDANNSTDITILRSIEGYLLDMKIFTYDTALTLLSKIIISQINSNKYIECLGLITDDLLLKYIKVLGKILVENPKYKFIIDYFIMATREIYINKDLYNKNIISKNSMRLQ